MFPILQIGGLAVQVPGLILLAGLWVGLNAAERWSLRYGIQSEILYNLVFSSLIAGLIGARLTYAGLNLEAFVRTPSGLLSLRPELLDPLGGAAVAALTAGLILQRRAISLISLLSALTPLLAVIMIAIPTANLASGSGFGAETSVPWALELWGAPRHPSQIYEMIAGSLIFFYMYRRFWSRSPGQKQTPGQAFFSFIILAAASRLFLEGFRGDSLVIGPGLRVVQLGAWVTAALGYAGLWRVSGEGGALPSAR